MEKSPIFGSLSSLRSIRIPERGYTDIDTATWAQVASCDEFWRLVEHGFISISRPLRHGIRIHGLSYVGRAICSGVLIDVHEKIQHTLSCLLQYTTHAAFKLEKAPAQASEMGGLFALLVRQFLSGLSSYISKGRESHYIKRRFAGSLVGGKLDITRCLRWRARGMGHILAFEKDVLSYATPVNRVFLATLREIDRLTNFINIPASDLARSRGIAILFADCRDNEVLFGRREEFVLQARNMIQDRYSDDLRDLLALAAVILSNESFELSANIASTVPRSWFLNLETLFETAIFILLRQLLVGKYSVINGRSIATPIFTGELREFRANPDLTLSTSKEISAVGDVKYKLWSGTAAAADIYQLLVHAAAFRSHRSFLIYPHDRFEVRFLGTSATGSATWLFALDIRNLKDNLELVFKEMGL